MSERELNVAYSIYDERTMNAFILVPVNDTRRVVHSEVTNEENSTLKNASKSYTDRVAFGRVTEAEREQRNTQERALSIYGSERAYLRRAAPQVLGMAIKNCAVVFGGLTIGLPCSHPHN